MDHISLALAKHYLILHLHLKIEFLYNSHAPTRSSFTDDKLARPFSFCRSGNILYCWGRSIYLKLFLPLRVHPMVPGIRPRPSKTIYMDRGQGPTVHANKPCALDPFVLPHFQPCLEWLFGPAMRPHRASLYVAQALQRTLSPSTLT
jgi:hypothetical protein